MGAVLMAEAEIHRTHGALERACVALDGALNVFYGVTGLLHYAAWVHLQHAYLSLELGDGDEAARRLDQAWAGFSDSRTQFGLDHCIALGERLPAANGVLTGAGWTPPGQP
jgi:hypothetical protein